VFGYYNINSKRQVSYANQNSFIIGMNHPDRIMEEHDLVYIIEGSWQIYQNDTPYMVQAGDVILLHAGQHHYGVKPCEPNTKTMYIHVSADKNDYFGNADFSGEKSSSMEINTLVHCQINTSVKRLFGDIISAYWSDTPTKESKISAMFQLLLCELYELKDSESFSDMKISEKVIQIIHSNPQEFFTAKELAERLFVSERTLRNKFIKAYNQTIYQYQIETKLEKSRQLLKDFPKMKLHELAVNLGFYDEFHFSKSFKKRYDVSPTKYKNSL
jgi:AraC-like DNA-binding protein